MFKFLVFAGRAQGLNPAEFEAAYESKYVPKLKELSGDKFPLGYARRYIHRTDAGDATVLFGNQSDFVFDLLVEFTFADKDAFTAFTSIYQAPETVAALGEAEKGIVEASKYVAVVVGSSFDTVNGKDA